MSDPHERIRIAKTQAAFGLCEGTVARLGLGGAFTKDTGQRGLARKAPRVVAIEGCPIACGTRMMQGCCGGGSRKSFSSSPASTQWD